MSELRMASSWPSWMTQPRPKQASAVIQSTPPRSLPDPKRMRWTQAAPEIELAHSPESPTTAMTQAVHLAAEATTQVVPQAGEPKTSILDELLGAPAPHQCTEWPYSVPELASTSAGPAESGAPAAAPAAAAPVVPKGAAKSEPIELPETSPAGNTELNPKYLLELIEYEVGLMGRDCKMGDSDATACRGFV